LFYQPLLFHPDSLTISPVSLPVSVEFLNYLTCLYNSYLACSTPATIPTFNNTRLPNPFILNDGRPVTSVEDWACRRAQISALIQGYEAGFLPPKPEIVRANFTQSGSSGVLGVTAGFSNKTISFSSTINFPSGNVPANGWPLLIAYDGLSIPVPNGVC
jgi:hypothetical protein